MVYAYLRQTYLRCMEALQRYRDRKRGQSLRANRGADGIGEDERGTTADQATGGARLGGDGP